MPTYENTSTEVVTVTSPWGEQATFKGTETKGINFYVNHPALTPTSDEPFYNDVLEDDPVVNLSGAAQDVAVNPEAKYFCVLEITGNVTVHRQSTSNTPAAMTERSDITPVMEYLCAGTCSVLKVTGSGSCRIVQYNR